MNKLINKYLANLEFYVGFELDENFEETIKLGSVMYLSMITSLKVKR